MLSRTLGSLLRGSSAPMNLFLACIVGCLLGFVPGMGDHLGLVVIYAFLLLVLNANLGLSLLLAGLTKPLAIALMGTAFSLGRTLVDGPLNGLVAATVEAPVLTFLDLDVYAVTGGMVIAIVLGVVVGALVVSMLQGFRKKFGALEAGSEKYQSLMKKKSVRFLVWLLLGSGHGKKRTYNDLLEKGFGKPIRVWGLGLVVVLLAALWLLPSVLGGFITNTTRSQLEQVNGATVDLDALTLALLDGKVELSNLALADKESLDTDVLRSVNVSADASVSDLLRGRLAVDTMVISESRQGAQRDVPGVLVERPEDDAPAPEPPPPSDEPGIVDATLETLFEDGEMLKERLAQAKEWLDKLSGGEDEEVTDEQTIEERILEEIEAFGYGLIRAPGMRSEAPAVLLRELVVDGMQTMALGDELLDIRGTSLSSDPKLVDEPPHLTATSRGGTLDLELGLGGPDRPPEANRVHLALNGLSGDTVGAMLGGGKLAGGSVDLALDGAWKDGRVGQLDLPFTITLRDAVVDIVGGPRQVSELTLPFRISGSLAAPRISWEGEALQQALLAQAEAELQALADEKEAELRAKVDAEKAKLDAKKDEAINEKKKELEEKVGGALGGLFGGDDDGE